MTLAEEAVQLARHELEHRTFAVTKQYLALHTVLTDGDGRAAVARVDEASEIGAAHVCFGLRDVPYHCVVAVRPKPDRDLSVDWVYIQPATRAYLAIRSDDVPPDEVTRRIGLQPSRTRVKGTPFGRRGSGAVTKTHLWALDAPEIPGELDEKVGSVVAAIEGVAPAIAALRPACSIEFVIVYEGWVGNSSLGGVQLTSHATQVLAQAGAALDVDIYAFGPPLTHTADDGEDA